MTNSRTNLDGQSSNLTYIILTVVLVILSFAGGLYLYSQFTTPKEVVVVEDSLPTPTPEYQEIPDAEYLSPSPTIPNSTVTPKVSPKSSSTPSPTTTPKALITPTPTPEFLNLNSSDDGFSLTYSSSRRLYQDVEASGNRYTLYRTGGNIAIHVGSNWSWSHPQRLFTSDKLIAGQKTFIYDIDSQTIYDFEVNGIKYTIQCVHNGSDSIKQECAKLIESFKLL